jgi:hypothetical protein
MTPHGIRNDVNFKSQPASALIVAEPPSRSMDVTMIEVSKAK